MLLLHFPVSLIRLAYWQMHTGDAFAHDQFIDNTYNSYRGGRTGTMFEVVDACLFKVFPELESQYTGGLPVPLGRVKDVPAAELPNAAPITWICPRCTFDNRLATVFCGNCLSRRPKRG